MIQTIYSSVNNAKLTPCDKRIPIKSDPIPLLKENFLKEFRTSLEKAKARANLGIGDAETLQWGNIQGVIERLQDLVDLLVTRDKYTNAVSENIKDIKTALDYLLNTLSNFLFNNELIEKLSNDLDSILELILDINKDFSSTQEFVTIINESITTLNLNILNSKSLDNNLEIKISNKENNNLRIEEDGLYIVDQAKYNTELDNSILVPETVGGISKNTSVQSLKGRTIVSILDQLIFPTLVRDLIYPSLKYNIQNQLVEVGTSSLNPELIFTKNDAGEELFRTETINGLQLDQITTYTTLGLYVYSAEVSYSEGDYLVDNKGLITDRRVEAGTVNTTLTITTTYPWYAGNINLVTKQSLIKFNTISGLIEIVLDGQAVIKLPGANSTINQLQVNSGIGYLDTEPWNESTEMINGIVYKVWTKPDSYSGSLQHRINFKLLL